VVQRLGDCNQTLFDGDAGWEPAEDAIDLGSSRRFPVPIADFASKITARRPQTILGADYDDTPIQPAVISYPKDYPQSVLPTFARLVHDELPAGANSWVVGWVHRPTGSKSAVSLQAYAPAYRPPTGPRPSSDSLFEIISAACHVSKAGGDLGGPVRSVRKGLLRLLRRQGVDGASTIWSEPVFKRWLVETDPDVARNIDRLLVEALVSDVASFAQAENWDTNAQRVVVAVSPLLGDEPLTKATKSFLKPPSEVKATAQDVLGMQRASVDVEQDATANLNLGSVASVKGCTHDATLVVQTTKGSVRDVRTALELAIGKRKRKDLGTDLLRGVTNVFVGATRPRRLVCLALPGDDLTPAIRKGLDEWKWRIIEATA
jgi:DNA helicase II / ATP-dependent DNA helicase PcrA